MPAEETKKPYLVSSKGPSKATKLDDVVDKLTPDSLDPDEELRKLRLPEKLEEILQGLFEPYGMKIEPSEVTDAWDATQKRPITRAYGDQGEIALLHMPKWIVANANHAAELHKLKSSLWKRTARIIAPACDNSSLTFSEILEDWGADPRDERKVDAGFVPWNHLKELTAGKHNTAKVFSLEIQEVEAAPAKPEKEAEAEVEADAEAEKEPAPVRDRVFISYAGEDEKKHKWLTRLQDHIDPLQDAFIEKRPELADEELIFDATKIKPGEQWRERIDEALARAKVGVLLVSKAFLVSPFIKTEEALPILLAAKEEGLTILWVLLDVCNWEQTEIAKFQAMNETKPLAVMKKTQAEKVLKKLSKLIFEELEK